MMKNDPEQSIDPQTGKEKKNKRYALKYLMVNIRLWRTVECEPSDSLNDKI